MSTPSKKLTTHEESSPHVTYTHDDIDSAKAAEAHMQCALAHVPGDRFVVVRGNHVDRLFSVRVTVSVSACPLNQRRAIDRLFNRVERAMWIRDVFDRRSTKFAYSEVADEYAFERWGITNPEDQADLIASASRLFALEEAYPGSHGD